MPLYFLANVLVWQWISLDLCIELMFELQNLFKSVFGDQDNSCLYILYSFIPMDNKPLPPLQDIYPTIKKFYFRFSAQK